MPVCVALFSGGLDSTLALRMMTVQGIGAVAFYAYNGFHGADDPEAKIARLRERALSLGARDFVVRDLGLPLIELVKNPPHGRGKNMNPCLDCRIRTLAEGAAIAGEIGADFLVTGEVVGQRPMSQRRDAMRTVEKRVRDWGWGGKLLRPLSAKLLEPTIPEEQGQVDREKLAGIGGRGRTPQLALAAELGITEFPLPAGGCLLTDPGYSLRLRELHERCPDWGPADAERLKIGRHFRLPSGLRILASRKAEENERMKTALPEGAAVFVTEGRPGAMVALFRDGDGGGEVDGGAAPSEDFAAADEAVAAGLAVYYSKFRDAGVADVARWAQGVAGSRTIRPATALVDPESLRGCYIGHWQGAAARPTGGE